MMRLYGMRKAPVHGRLPTHVSASYGVRRALQCRAQHDEVPVRFRVRKQVKFGEKFKVVGNHPSLGDWNVDKALELQWHDNDVWAAEAKVPVGKKIEFKCVRVGKEVSWEDGRNRNFEALGPKFSLDVRCLWGDTANTDVHAHELQEEQPTFRELASLLSMDHAAAEEAAAQEEWRRERREREEKRRWEKEQQQQQQSSGSESSYLSDDDAPDRAWQGRGVTFMRSNNHSKERSGKWDTTGLSGPLLSMVKGDEKAANWLGKLGVVKGVLVDQSDRCRPNTQELAAAYVYLQWVTTGALACVEGGGHYRPNHHARLGQDMFRALEWTLEEDWGQERMRTILSRKLQPLLPSFSEAFTQSVPLTRIRDIAHRNDLPHEIKQEIKHTLQNKLHRNAGPEDLLASAAMLDKLKQHNCSGAAIHEFEVFMGELRDFFNAASLTSILDKIAEGMDPENKQVMGTFMAQKAALDAKGSAGPQELVGVMHALTGVRALLASGLSSGLRNDAPDSALAMRQRWRLGEVRCEDYFFVLLSRFINAMEEQGGYAALSTANDRGWSHPMAALVLGLRHMGMSGWCQAECMALERELHAWQQAGALTEKTHALRLKATLERLVRLTESYTESILEVLPPPATGLGHALGIAPHIIATFTEADLRASVVFQVSKLSTLVLKACRAAAGSSPWDALVAGEATGTLIQADTLDPSQLQKERGPVVLLLHRADGDEEITGVGGNLKGIVLAQDLPHLSHLGVRARQEKMPFATLDDPQVVTGEVSPLLGQLVTLKVTPTGVTLTKASSAEAAAAGNGQGGKGAGGKGKEKYQWSQPEWAGDGPPPEAYENASLVDSPRVIPLLDCSTSLGGAKASACAQLEQIALSSAGAARFRTPKGLCVPFGNLECALEAWDQASGGGMADRARQLLMEMEEVPVEQLDQLCRQMQELISRVPLPPVVLQSIRAAFSPGTRLICRSSSNVEDLEGMSGAGLYESIMNVPVDRPEDVGRAVAAVWASTYTRRAVLSRRAAGVKQAKAKMAVLIQEMLAPDLSFVLHSASPLGDAPGTAVAEVAAGLGETLASGARGSPWRLAVNKATGKVDTLSFANFSTALLPAGTGSRSTTPGGPGGIMYRRSAELEGGVAVQEAVWEAVQSDVGVLYECDTRTMDYSHVGLSASREAREALGQQLGAVAAMLEREFRGPQDVEGCCVGPDIYIVQSRPQPL